MAKNKIRRYGRMYEPLTIMALLGIIVAAGLPVIKAIRTTIRTGVENGLDWISIIALTMVQSLLGIVFVFFVTFAIPLCLMGICFLVNYLNERIQKRRR